MLWRNRFHDGGESHGFRVVQRGYRNTRAIDGIACASDLPAQCSNRFRLFGSATSPERFALAARCRIVHATVVRRHLFGSCRMTDDSNGSRSAKALPRERTRGIAPPHLATSAVIPNDSSIVSEVSYLGRWMLGQIGRLRLFATQRKACQVGARFLWRGRHVLSPHSRTLSGLSACGACNGKSTRGFATLPSGQKRSRAFGRRIRVLAGLITRPVLVALSYRALNEG
ncbi:hypothetical protein OKW50_004962 [Paraburkholderia youngii]